MSRPLKILYICSELTPLVKTGGLADVSGALPRALRALGHDVRVAMPLFRQIPEANRGKIKEACVADLGWGMVQGVVRETCVPNTDIPLYLVEHEEYFGRSQLYGGPDGDYPDNIERFAFFSLAVLDTIPKLRWTPDVLHCHDWHTALVPVYCRTRLARHPVWGGMPILYTIHNLAYQGLYPADTLPRGGLGWEQFTPDGLEFFGEVNMMKGGIAAADKINTVSRRYAREIQTKEYGERLHGILQARKRDLCGIVNGIDYAEWDPASDPLTAAPFTQKDLSGKAACKRALQKRMGLPARDVPLIGMVSRIVAMKGFDLLVAGLDELMKQDLQLVVLGTGDTKLEEDLAAASECHPEKVQAALIYDNELAHQIYAGSDFFLMPSRVEPCGLSQMYAMAYGTPPIVRRTGGLADTVHNATPTALQKGEATGIVFLQATRQALVKAVLRACALYEEPSRLDALRRTGMQQDFSWDRSSKEYVKLYRRTMRAR